MLFSQNNIILDTCCLLNMVNGDVLDVICGLPNYKFFIGPLVHEECTKKTCEPLENELESGRIQVLGEDLITLKMFTEQLDKYKLGDGETECIAYGKELGYIVSSDDLKARNSIEKEIGRDKLTGTITLLRMAIQRSLLSCEDAFFCFKVMKLRGGFLPKMDQNTLCQ